MTDVTQEVTTTATGTSLTATVDMRAFQARYLHVETPPETCRRRSSECAEIALHWGARGRDVTAEGFAELADLYAVLADMIDAASIIAWQIPSERYWHSAESAHV